MGRWDEKYGSSGENKEDDNRERSENFIFEHKKQENEDNDALSHGNGPISVPTSQANEQHRMPHPHHSQKLACRLRHRRYGGDSQILAIFLILIPDLILHYTTI